VTPLKVISHGFLWRNQPDSYSGLFRDGC